MTYFQQLISYIDLHAILGSKNLVVLDASIPPVGNMAKPVNSWPEYSIPNARRFDLNQNFSDLASNLPHTMPSAMHFEKAAKALGINQQSQIVVYDDLGLFSAARAWYMFRAMGHKNIAVLDGGLPYWLKLKKPMAELPTAINNTYQQIIGNFVAKEQVDSFVIGVKYKRKHARKES
jgi:thiosulfate/3-mercaptopyruvate sulfurtransferase